MYQYVLRVLGVHPIPEKNVLYFECPNKHYYSIKTRPEDNVCTECGEKLEIHKRKSRTYRLCAETLPGDKGDTGKEGTSSEIKNTVYPALKTWLPSMLIKKDITFRNPAMIVKDPNAGMEFGDLTYEGGDIIFEFVSYNQSTQSTAGVQRLGCYCDEEPPSDFYKEQLPRLLQENGDFIIGLTPASYISWTYDEIFEKASIYYRSKVIVDYLAKEGQTVKQIEKTDFNLDIAVLQAATDDNPTLDLDVIDEMFKHYDDPDDIAIRRYGIFKQVSGRIFKDFEYSTHFINGEKYFPDGIPRDGWVHARGIDYHPQTPWASSSMSLSPTDEAFVWIDFNPSPEKLTTKEIAKEVALMGKDYKFTLNIIDPLVKATSDGGVTTLDDFNGAFYEYKQENIGTGGYWQVWDTKGEKGRDAIRTRLKNSSKVGKPFNNKVVKDGRTQYLPTLWILGNCKNTAQSMRQWRWEEWADPKSRNTKDAKNKPMQKWSHFCMVIEAIFKEPAFRARDTSYRPPAPRQHNYFKGRGR
jgi:phage terminase large subunit-like protein